MTKRGDLIRQHVPSISDEDDDEIVARAYWGEELAESADLALRTCMCGKRIDGFYEYVDHLEEVLKAEGLW